MKRIHEYENEVLETYYALGKGNKFLKEIDNNGAFIDGGDLVILCKEPKDAYTFVRYDKAKQFLTEYSKMLEGFKIYSIRHYVKTETQYDVFDCDTYKDEQKGIMVMGEVVPCGKFDKDGNRI